MKDFNSSNPDTAKPVSAFHDLKNYNPLWGKGIREIDFYVGKDMNKRTKRLICRTAKASRTEPARPLLTVLLDVIRNFRVYKDSIAVRKASDLYRGLGLYASEHANQALSKCRSDRSSDLENNGCLMKDCLSPEELTEHGKSIYEVLMGLVRREIGAKEKYVTRKIMFDWDRIDFLIANPNALKREISRCIEYSNKKKKRDSRRRRGSRINRKRRDTLGTS